MLSKSGSIYKMKLRKLLILVAYFVHTVSCQNEGSLSFVIDNSYSMKTDIDYVKHGVADIIDMILKKNSSRMENFVLVTFNNTSYKKIITTRDKSYLKKVLKNIHAGNTRRTSKDCSKMSLRGVKLALESSENYSNLFVFTNASPKDYKLTKEVIQLAQKKSSQVLFIITEGNHCIERPSMFNPYYEIANATYGQVLKINAKTEIKKVLNYTAETCTGERTVLVQSHIPANKILQVTFDIDDETEYVVISASGSNVEIYWAGIPNLKIGVEGITWLKNFKAVNLLVPESGRYSVTVRGSSVTYVIGYGKTSFLFSYGFSLSPVRSLRDTVKNPTAGEKNLLAISMNDPNRAVSVDAVELLDMNKKVLAKLSLTRKSSDFYTTKLFLPPKSAFLIAVLGKGKYLQRPIKRISETAIQPKIKYFGPIVTVNKVKNSYEYNSKLYLNCNVKGHPKPHLILWRLENGTNINAPIKNYPPYNYSTHLTVTKVKKSQRYTCFAENKFGKNSKKDVFVKVDPPFVVNTHLKGVTYVSFEKDIELICDIKSKWPMRITWWKNGRPVTSSLSNDGTKLTINKVNIQDQDTYTCEAKLLEDDEKRSYQTKLKIKELKPIVTVDQIKKTYEYNSTIRLNCYVKGYPKPQIHWIDESGTILRNQIYLQYSSNNFSNHIHIEKVKKPQRYTCHAQNHIGNNTQNVFVNVDSPFVVKKHLEDVTFVSFEKDIELICDIKSKWPMRITWSMNGKTVISSLSNDGTKLTIRKVNIQDLDTYTCEAKLLEDGENDRRSYQTKLKIKELKPIVTVDQIKKTYEYNSTIRLNCYVKGYPKPQIHWTDQSGTILRNQIYLKYSAYNFSNQLTIEKVKKPQRYTCHGQNHIGNNSQNVFVNVGSPFVVKKHLEDVTFVSFEKDIELICDIKSKWPMRITWWKNGRPVTSSLSNDGTKLTINKVNIQDQDTYTCEAKLLDDDEKRSYQTKLKIKELKPIVTIEQIKKTYKFNSTLYLNCNVKAPSEPQTYWKDQNGVTLRNMTIKKNSPFDYSYNLTVEKINKSQNYTCISHNKFGNNSENVYVKVDSASVVSKYLKDAKSFAEKIRESISPQIEKPTTAFLIVKKAAPVTLTCKITKGFPAPERVWIFKEIDSDKWFNITNSEESLTIERSQLSSGDYKCLASNPIGHDKMDIHLTVEVPPEIVSSQVTVSALELDLVLRIPCETFGYPKPNVTWRVNGSTIGIGTKYNLDKTSLIILNPVKHDSGNYTCEVQNLFGSDSKTIEAIVKSNAFIINPSIKETMTAKLSSYQNIEKKDQIIEYNILEGSIISLNCLHAKNDTVIWYKDNQYLTITGPSLVIMKATTNDDGIYKCLVYNYSYNETQFYSFKINVGYEPRGNTDPVIINKDGNLNQTLSKSLECQFDVKPMTNEIEWTFNGERIIENTTDFNGDITEGIYTCSITNLYGTAKRTFTVVSHDCLIKKSQITKNAPLILSGDSIWPHIYYNENYLRVPRNTSLKMFCSNQKETNIHFQSFSNNNEILATCVGENKFSVNGTIVKFEDLQCNLPIRHIINETGATCFNENTELVKVGFEVDQFVEVYEVCVDKTTMVPLYTRIDMTPLYNVKSTQFATARVNEIIGDKCGESSKCCFGKTKLVSENYVRYGPSRAATFIEMNYVPYWRPCDGQLGWNDIEENITRKLEQIEGQFIIWSGASNYTKKSDVTVPRYLWKVIKIVDSEYSFSFVYVNDPNPTLEDKLCKDICNQFDWITSSYSTYCCRLEEFRKAFHIPENLQ